jgi:site-specific DNA-methyltransferase (adenine-specific)
VLLGKRRNGRTFVADVINVRENGADVRQLILNTAASDNALYGNVTIRLPQDPGQAGKDQAQSFVRMWRGDKAQAPSKKYIYSGAKAENAGYIGHDFDGDNMDQRAFISYAEKWLRACGKLVKTGGVAAVFTDWRQIASLYDAIQWSGWVLRGLMVWDKKNAMPQPARPRQQCEFIVWASNGPLDAKRDAPILPGCFSQKAIAPVKRIHQAEKPLELMRQLVHITERGGRIIDPFAGSGTTVCAAALEGFDATGIERNEYYAEKARKRLREVKR